MVIKNIEEYKNVKKREIKYKRNKNEDLITNSILNIKLILENDSLLKNTFKFNKFTEDIDVIKDIPSCHIEKGYFKDDYLDEIAYYIENNPLYSVLFDIKRIRSAITIVANNNAYNPVIDYLNGAKKDWDKTERMDNFFIDYLGVENSECTQLITKLFFYGVITKAMKPKSKFDFVLDLIGGQGIGKTTLLQRISPLHYYTDQFLTFTDKDDFAIMRKCLIANDDELAATHKATFEEVKRFVTLNMFEYRKPYGRESARFYKKFVLVRTTNEIYYLKDKTGERRFLPLLARKDKQAIHPVDGLSDEEVKQIWGEAMNKLEEDKDFSFKLTKDQEIMLNKHRESFMYTDEVEETIFELLNGKFKDRTFLRNTDIAFEISPGVNLATNRKLSNQIANIMVNKYHWRKGMKKINGEAKRGYFKK